MVDKEYIRKLYYLEGWSIRKISRQLPVSRPIIRKMLSDEGIPKYNLVEPRLSPVMDEYRPILEQWLREDSLTFAHCTQHKAELKKLYPQKYIEGGTGRIIEI